MPTVDLNGGDLHFGIRTQECCPGEWIGEVVIDGVTVWILPVPRRTQDAAYAATRRRVVTAFRGLAGSVHREN